MFCQNCGKKIADDAKFCDGCGAVVNGTAPRQTTAQSTVPVKKEKQKKKTPIWLIILVALAAYVIGRTLIAPAMMSGSEQKNGTSYEETTGGGQLSETFSFDVPDTPVEADTQNAAYDEIFSSHYIVKMDTLFFGMDSAAFAKEDSDGMIDCIELGYQDDVVRAWVETVYIDISGMSETDKTALDSQLRDTYGALESLSYATISYNLGSSYYTLTIRLDDLDQSDVLHDAVDQGLIVVTGEADILSMSMSESNLLAQGYVKR